MFKDEDEVVAKETTSTDEHDSIASTTPTTKDHIPVTERTSQDSDRSKDIVQRSAHPLKPRRTSKSRYIRRQSNASIRSFGRLNSIERSGSGERRLSSTREHESGDDDDDSFQSPRHEWAFDQIAMSEESDSEFFDARGERLL